VEIVPEPEELAWFDRCEPVGLVDGKGVGSRRRWIEQVALVQDDLIAYELSDPRSAIVADAAPVVSRHVAPLR
jgi:hypothetical protein